MSRLRIVPLDDAVIFPGMTVTLPVDDAGGDARVLLVPRQGSGFAHVGVVAEVSNRVRLSGHSAALSLLGLHRGIPGDHYLDFELDVSHVLFIATANVAETIPAQLLGRMEVIRFDGYTSEEKVAIARGHLWPRQSAMDSVLKKQP